MCIAIQEIEQLCRRNLSPSDVTGGLLAHSMLYKLIVVLCVPTVSFHCAAQIFSDLVSQNLTLTSGDVGQQQDLTSDLPFLMKYSML